MCDNQCTITLECDAVRIECGNREERKRPLTKMNKDAKTFLFPLFFFTIIYQLSYAEVQIMTHLSDPTHSIVVIWIKLFQTELMVEINSKSLVRAIGKILLVNLS